MPRSRPSGSVISISAVTQTAYSPYSYSSILNQWNDLMRRCVEPAAWSAFLWSSCSISMVLLNKLILTTFDFQYNILMLIYQNAICVFAMVIARQLGFMTFEQLTLIKLKQWLPLNVFFVFMLFTGTFSLKYLSVPMVTVFKNSNNIVITFFDFLFYQNPSSNGVILSLGIMLVAAVLASVEDLEFSLAGYIWTLLNCICTAAFVLYMPKAMSLTNLSSFGKVYYNNVLSIPLLFLIDILFFGDCVRLYHEGMSTWSMELHILLFISGIAGFALSASAFQCMQHTSPTTYSLLGSLNKIPLTMLGVWLFQTKLTLSGSVYVGLSLLAGTVFGYTKAKEQELSKSKPKSVNTKVHQLKSDKSSTDRLYELNGHGNGGTNGFGENADEPFGEESIENINSIEEQRYLLNAENTRRRAETVPA